MLLPKIVGIDLDNTIINYNDAFIFTTTKLNLLSREWCKSNLLSGNGISQKNLIKKAILNKKNGQRNWECLQGQVYGNFIQYAHIFSGVANFLFHCKNRGIEVFIISHKTKFGHYDKSKIPLRKAAINFLKQNNILTKNYGLSKERVFFLDTREKKVKKIRDLKCDYFIDDLPEVFSEPNFPKNTKKIVFSPTDQISYNDTFNNWRKINEYFFNDIKPIDISGYVEFGLKKPVKTVNKIKGRANSTIFKIEMQMGQKYVGKLYPDNTNNNRKRLENEIKAYKFMHLNKIDCVANNIWFDCNLNFGLFEWINGSKIKNVNNKIIVEALSFIKSLALLSKITNYNNFEMASAACLSGKMIENQIWDRFKKIDNYSYTFSELNNFLNNDLLPSFEKILKKSKKLWPNDFNYQLERINQILSPSDFGFHNAIHYKNGIKFFDFEYFGWDDPVKLTCDFMLHPGMKITNKQKFFWFQTMNEIFKSDKNFQKRIIASYELYGLCWCLINLNVYLKIDWTKKNYKEKEKQVLEEKKYLQLEKSRELLKHINSDEQKWATL